MSRQRGALDRATLPGMRQTGTAALAVVVLCATAGAAGAAGGGASGTDPSYVAEALTARAMAEQRGLDQDANPAYAAAAAPGIAAYLAGTDTTTVGVDPLLAGWTGTVGDVAFRNRYGAVLRGHSFVPRLPWRDPVTGRTVRSGLPGVVFVPGLGSTDAEYRGPLEQLADAGYVVVAVAPQGAGASDVDPSPTSEFCGDGPWRRPQEAGLREVGRCAGYDGPEDPRTPTEKRLTDLLSGTPAAGTPAYDEAGLAGLEADLVEAKATGDYSAVLTPVTNGYASFRPRFVFAALDAASWLRSSASPFGELLDSDRLAVVGHSAGSDAAFVAANGDPQHRFVTAVAWDDYGGEPPGAPPSVPTLMFQTEQEQLLGPWLPRPPARLWPAYTAAERFASSTVPFELLALRGSTHQEWSYVPYAANDPVAPLSNSNGRAGEVAVYETIAWLDRYLKTGRSAEDGARRLRLQTLDGYTDAFARGQGTYDPAAQRNVPYHVAGLRLDDVLSRIFASQRATGDDRR